MMKRFGLIGKTLKHSFSKQYFENYFKNAQLSDCCYDLFEIHDIHDISSLIIRYADLQGFNVTIPYKQSIIPFLDTVDPTAEAVGAVNCVRITRESGKARLCGFNTDVEGFRNSLPDNFPASSVLILGTGGAAAAVAFALRQEGVAYRFVSRTAKEENLLYSSVTEDIIRQYYMIINCTPVGMFPHTDEMPALPYTALTPQHFLYDLIYNPPLTRFLAEGKKHRSSIQNGLQMLHLQAEASWRIFNG